jgi:two-component system cell cycle response regulator
MHVIDRTDSCDHPVGEPSGQQGPGAEGETGLDARSIVWVLPSDDYDNSVIEAGLTRQGYSVRHCIAKESPRIEGELRVLPAEHFANVDELHLEFDLDARPTLVLAKSAALRIAALEFMRDQDDVCDPDEPPELIARHLQRIALRASNARRVESLQQFDALTGLGNRRVLMERLARLRDEMPPRETVALLLLDIDHFKNLNDRFGHAIGDQVLQEFAKLLRDSAAPGDELFRLGGEEFVWVMSRYDRLTVVHDGEKILQTVARQRFVPTLTGNDERVQVTVSAGLIFLSTQLDPETLLRQADISLYKAKSSGRNKLVLYESLRDSANPEDGDLYLQHFENVTRVVTERVTNLVTQMGRRLVESALREANQDALTQVNNRRYFNARIAREVESARRHHRKLTIALMDIDHFHDVNLTFGWPTGDSVLRGFADTANKSIRIIDWLARYGGEEFCLVMPDTDLETGGMVAERIRRSVENSELKSLDQRRVPVTVSIGVAQLTSEIGDPIGLTQKASDALLEAKHSGRNRVIMSR